MNKKKISTSNKKILIASSGQPCGNPRMVKEAICLSHEGFVVTVIYCPLSTWGDEFDRQLFNENPQINWIRIGAHPMNNRLHFIFTRIRRKFWEWIYRFFGNKFHAALKSSVLYCQELEKEANKHKADLYIGHNLGSIRAVIGAAQKFNAKLSFDFEDFHRGEDHETSLHWKRTREIEDEFVPQLSYATAASPLIGEAYYKNYNNLLLQSVLNVFPKSNRRTFVVSKTKRLYLFWFSQTIGLGRGLEFMIEACANVKPQPQLTLLGNCTEEVENELIKIATDSRLDLECLKFKGVVSEYELGEIAAKHHIGLCTEDAKTLNRNLCLTNKIFTYMLGKNVLLLSNTNAQKAFWEVNQDIGQIIELGNPEQIRAVLQMYQDDRDLLEKHRIESLRLAQEKYNWESESKKLIDFYQEFLVL